MHYSIQEVARAAGTTSRTLRHYDSLGLVRPVRVGQNRYRYYDDGALIRLQRVLLLRELGLGLGSIAEVLNAQDAHGATQARGDGVSAEASILDSHLELLRSERERIDRQIGAVERTIAALTERDTQNERIGLMAENMFDGFDHTQHKEEVEARWGADACKKSDSWWRGLGKDGQREWQARVAQLNTDWAAAAESGADPTSDVAQVLAARHAEWLRSVPGTPSGDDFSGYLLGLGEMYVADERFAANYGGVTSASFVRDALKAYVERGETRV